MVNVHGRDIGRGVNEDVEDSRRLAGLLASLDSARRILEHDAALGTADMRLLWLFTDGEPRTLRRIAEELGLEQSTINRQVNAAVNAGLLVKSRTAGQGSYFFTRSPEGADEFESTLSATLDAYDSILELLEPDRDRFLTLMTRFVNSYHHVVNGMKQGAPLSTSSPS